MCSNHPFYLEFVGKNNLAKMLDIAIINCNFQSYLHKIIFDQNNLTKMLDIAIKVIIINLPKILPILIMIIFSPILFIVLSKIR